jgi:hypothetical protein
LAREPARDDVNASAPRSPVERAHVVPDRERVEQAVALALGEDALTVRLDLDRADRSPPEEPRGKQSASGSGK